MNPDLAAALLNDKRAPLLIGALALLLFLITNLPWQLDDYDQAKQAYTSFEMMTDGHWFYQQTPHDKVATKPPLIGWISSGLFAMTRSWDIAWRSPSLIAAVALAFLVFRFAASAYGGVAGLVGLAAFGLNLLTPRLATLVRTDMPLALVISLIGLQIWNHVRENRSWKTRDRFLLFLFLTAAMLIKGPIIYAFLLPGLLLMFWRRRKETGHRTGWWPWIASLAIFLIWVAGGIVFQPGFYEQTVMREFVGRFGETIHRPQPIYFYLPHLLHKFAPWSLLMIALAILGVGANQKLDGLKPSSLASSKKEAIASETLWLIVWSVGGLLVMSLVPSKRVDRIFPIIPPLCLLLAAQVSAALQSEERVFASPETAEAEAPKSRNSIRFWIVIALAFSVLFTGVYTMSKVIGGYRNNRAALVNFGRDVRAEAERRHLRYEVIRSDDEGLLLYLRKPHFIKPDVALSEWSSGNLDALVAPAEEAPNLVRQLNGAFLSPLKSEQRKEEPGLGYVLITH